MQFCSECGNMYYIKLNDDDTNSISYYCRKCGNKDDSLNEKDTVVSKTTIDENTQSFHHIINRYTKLDPTLPHTNTIKCINDECICNKDDGPQSDIICIKYDEEKMKYVYLCVHCDSKWTN